MNDFRAHALSFLAEACSWAAVLVGVAVLFDPRLLVAPYARRPSIWIVLVAFGLGAAYLRRQFSGSATPARGELQ